jgi:hypothetical protein
VRIKKDREEEKETERQRRRENYINGGRDR